MDRLLVACALVTLLGLAALAGLAYAREPRPIPFEHLARFDGQRVCVEAVLAHLRPVDAGAHLVFAQGNRSLAAFSRHEPDAATGDRVRACGSLDGSSGTLRMRLERATDVTVLERYQDRGVALSLVADRPWDFVDQHVAVRGIASRESGRSWLEDPTTGARMSLMSAAGVPVAAPLRILGLVEFDEAASAFHLRVLEATAT